MKTVCENKCRYTDPFWPLFLIYSASFGTNSPCHVVLSLWIISNDVTRVCVYLFRCAWTECVLDLCVSNMAWKTVCVKTRNTCATSVVSRPINPTPVRAPATSNSLLSTRKWDMSAPLVSHPSSLCIGSNVNVIFPQMFDLFLFVGQKCELKK